MLVKYAILNPDPRERIVSKSYFFAFARLHFVISCQKYMSEVVWEVVSQP